MSDSAARLPARPSLEQLRKRAKDLLRAARAGDAGALARLQHVTFDSAILADAQLAIAREYGFRSWSALVQHVRANTLQVDGILSKPLIRPHELRGARPYLLADGSIVTTEDVYRMFVAARAGDMAEVRLLLARAPGLAVVEYNYTPPIHFTVREGHRALTELLIARGADIASYRTYPFGDALLTMAEERAHHDVAALLRARLAQRFRVSGNVQRIIDAARDGDVAAVEAELARDPLLAQARNETGDTPLHHAAHGAHLAVVRVLLDAGADADAERGDGYRPIHLALMRNFLHGAPTARGFEIADLLLARGARCTMFVAALRGDHEFIRSALQRDVSLANEEDSCHHRPISGAARRNDIELVQMLLAHGADPNLPEEGAPRGHALWIAVQERRYELAQLLLEHGADPNGMVESSGTPMMRAEGDAALSALLQRYGGIAPPPPAENLGRILHEHRFADAERLIRARPELLEDEGGEGVLMGPSHAGDHEVIAFLMRMGARVPAVTKWAPFYYFKHERTAAFLLQNGMDPNHMNWHRTTLLHYMASEGELAKARLLLDHGADINAVDEEYRSTPLGLAARRGQRALVELLLERGADPDLAGAAWGRPVAWARARAHGDIVDMLLRAGAVPE